MTSTRYSGPLPELPLPDTVPVWSSLTTHMTELAALRGAISLLHWDQQTNMPKAAAATRGGQLAILSKIAHEKATDPAIAGWLADLEGADLDEAQQGGLRNIGRDYERATKLSSDLVERFAHAEAAGFQAWVQAKAASDFSMFAPHLQTLLDLTVEKCRAIDPDRHPYDVLLEGFDPGMTVAQLRPLFARLRDGLVELIEAVASADPLPAFEGRFDTEGQRRLHQELLTALGYDLDGGRLDPAEHPFTIGIGVGDVRITTHLYEDDLLSGLGGTIHEAGHGMYEQGLPEHLLGTGARSAASLGLHESQSRFWENFIGRSEPFFGWFEGKLREHFPGAGVTGQQMFRGANRVQPGLIRISADEVTYNLHIIVRFEIELAMLEGKLAVADVPAAWNAKYQEYLGITPPDDARGCLQDVHWSGAAFGYFPSYTLGNLYAASLGHAMSEAIPDLWDRVRAGDFAPVLGWLRDKVHHRAHIVDAPQIMAAAVGDRDSVEDLLNYLWDRHGRLYGVTRPR